ncbi:MAG: YitT family protein [Candidatus Cryptobacteroides sp.]
MTSKVLKTVKEYALLTFATFVFTVAWEAFMIPNQMSAGGFMGVCTIIEYASNGVIKASYSFFVLNAFLILDCRADFRDWFRIQDNLLHIDVFGVLVVSG